MIMEGTYDLKVYRGRYDFAQDLGAISTITLRADSPLPLGSVIIGGYIDVQTALTSGGAATVALQAEAANDLQTAITVAGAPWSTTGRKAITPVFTAASMIKTTASRAPAMLIAAFTVTAGKFDLVLLYI
jgi:hypothetical protein